MNKVHIIVPVYNPPAKFFQDCLRSIGEQTHEDFKCVLVDDGSAPATAAICDEVATLDPRFTVIHKKNEGTAFARRDGVHAALADNAEYIVFVDNDDTVESGYLSVLLGMLRKTNTDACFCWLNVVRNGVASASEWSPPESGVSDDKRGILAQLYGRPHKNFGVRYTVWAGIYRSVLFDGINWEFNNGLIGEDTRLLAQLVLNAGTVSYVPDKLYNHVQHGGNTDDSVSKFRRLCLLDKTRHMIADLAKSRVPGFDLNEYAAFCEYWDFNRELFTILDSNAENSPRKDDANECVRHILHAMKILYGLSLLSRRQRVGMVVLKTAGMRAYHAWHKNEKSMPSFKILHGLFTGKKSKQ